jgi:hypothetical protein
VVHQVVAPCDPAEDHRLGNPQLLRPQREIDVRDYEPDKAHAGEAVHHVGEPPHPVAEKIGIAVEDRRAHAIHHHDSGRDDNQARDHDDEVIETIAERILAGFRAARLLADFA